MGLGCHRALDPKQLEELALKTLTESSLALSAVSVLATIDSRAVPGEAPEALAKLWDKPLLSYSTQELGTVTVPTPSETVMRRIGAPSVCEAAAVLAARKGPLIVPKKKSPTATCAVALIDWTS
jgi:cobalamin biosynthesis protein CbiG